MKLNEVVKIRDNFQYAINLKYDLHSEDKIRNYIMTPGALEVFEDALMTISSNSTDKAKILIGPYGKGKSHLLLVLISLLKDLNSKSSKETLKIIKENNEELFKRIESLGKEKFKLLPVVVSASSLDMKQIILNSLMESLVINELGHLMPNSYYDSVKSIISLWLTDFPETYKALGSKLDCTIDEFISKMDNFDQEAYQYFKEIYPSLTAGSEFNPLQGNDIDNILVDVTKELSKYGYSGIYLVYDEFSKFLEGSIDKNSALDIKLLQDIAELCNRSKSNRQIHLTLISHKDIESYTGSLSKEKIDAWKAVAERFKRIEINNSKTQTYHLVSKVIEKDKKWKEVSASLDTSFDNLNSSLSKSGLLRSCGVESRTFIEMMYPLHPLTAILLPEIAEFVAQNERTLFTFLASKEKMAIAQVIKNIEFGDFILPDIIYDYFEDQFKKETFDTIIYKTWRSSKEICNAIEADKKAVNKELCKSIVKLIALIQMVNNYEVIAPTSLVLDICLNSQYNYDTINTSLEFLSKQNYLRYISSKKHYNLKSTRSIDIKQLIREVRLKREKFFNLEKTLTTVIKKEAIYPNKYNSEFEVIRYFKLVFVKASDLIVKGRVDSFLNKEKHEANFIAVLLDNEDYLEDVREILMENDDPLVFAAVNRTQKDFEELAHSADAVDFLIKENENGINDTMLDEEYKYQREEISSTIIDLTNEFFDPDKKAAEYFSNGSSVELSKKSQLNNYLSHVLEMQYSKMPIIVNEMITKDSINTSIRTARNKIIESLLKTKIKENLGFMGHGPEVSIMRTTLLNTGIYDGQSKITYENINDVNLKNVLQTIEDFVKKTSESGPVSFEKLYEVLTHPSYQIGLKRGLIPIYLSVVFHKYKKHIVITKNRHELDLNTSVINDLNNYPDKYCLYLEKWDDRKEKYLNALEHIFSDYVLDEEKERNSFEYIYKAMHRWFLYLPKYSKEYTVTYDLDATKVKVSSKSLQLRNRVKQSASNSREFLFEVLPRIFNDKDKKYEFINEIKKLRHSIDTFIDQISLVIIKSLIDIFSENNEKSLNSALNDWYGTLDDETKCHKFDDNSEKILTAIEYLSNNEAAFIEKFTHEMIGLSIEDWNDNKFITFMDEIKSCKTRIEEYDKSIRNGNRAEIDRSKYRVVYFDENNEECTHSFGNNGFATVNAHNLYNELSGVLDDYVYNLDKNEARQVIMEVLKKVL